MNKEYKCSPVISVILKLDSAVKSFGKKHKKMLKAWLHQRCLFNKFGIASKFAFQKIPLKILMHGQIENH